MYMGGKVDTRFMYVLLQLQLLQGPLSVCLVVQEGTLLHMSTLVCVVCLHGHDPNASRKCSKDAICQGSPQTFQQQCWTPCGAFLLAQHATPCVFPCALLEVCGCALDNRQSSHRSAAFSNLSTYHVVDVRLQSTLLPSSHASGQHSKRQLHQDICSSNHVSPTAVPVPHAGCCSHQVAPP